MLTPKDSHLAAVPHAGRQAERLALDFPYDWSNANMADDTLIAQVLTRARFSDVSKIFARFGTATVERVAQAHGIALGTGVLGALMPAIRRGEQLAQS